jgi:hypothetical protein
MQKARRHPKAPTACKHTVSGTISLLCSRFFSPFLHSTCTLSVFKKYLALPDGSGRFRQDLTCPALLRIPLRILNLRVRGYHPLRHNFPEVFHFVLIPKCGPTTPTMPKHYWFGLFPLRSPLLRESLLFSFPPGT